MNLQQGFSKLAFSLGLVLILAGAALAPRSAWASMEDAAIFYDELKQEGEWVDYGDYGPVWYPTQVKENWRPYVDGRWTPSEEGYVFETQEPWAPETYHYGNWMPTPEYGWVWVPGRTWYPNTVSWRTSPESEAPETSYVGWAPIPPPNYTPAPGYYPEGYTGGGAPYSGSPDSLIASPFWIFVRAASFLLGFNAPYAPAYSYWGSNALLPPAYVPYYYTRTIIVNNYYTPGYYPAGYIASGVGCYNWGPPIPYVARVTRINQTVINNYMQQVNIYQRRNVVPPPAVLGRRPYWHDMLPPAMLNHQALALGPRFQGAHVARANLVQPNMLSANLIKNAPGIPGTIPKARMAGVEAGPWRHGVPGAALPASAMIRPNRQMQEHLRNIPANQRLEPVSPSARKWTVPQTPGASPAATVVQPGREPRRRNAELTTPTPGTPGTTHHGPGPYGYSPPGTPQAVPPGQPAPHQEAVGRQRRMPTPEVATSGTPGPSQIVVPHERFKPAEQHPGTWGKHEQVPPAGYTPAQSSRQRQLQSSIPGTPPASPAIPPRVQPQPQMQHVPQPQPQMHHAPPPQPQQVQRQFQPQPQIHQQPQVHQQPQHQPQPQAQPRPQGQQKQQDNKKHNQQNQ